MLAVSMVGRGGELDELTRAWSRLSAGRGALPRTVVITGDAGVGKSALVATALETLAPAPAVILSGTARVHAPAPYDWLAAVLSGRDTGVVDIPADALAWLAQHPDAPSERYAPGALLRLAVRTVRALIGSGPAVLVVEDLHALDPASLNLVGEIATAPDLPVLVIVTSRLPAVSRWSARELADEALSPQLAARTLARLTGTPHAVRQHLGPLDAAGVGEILAEVYPDSVVGPAAIQAIWERTSGNPYRLIEFLATAGAGGLEILLQTPLPDHVRLHDEVDLTARESEVLSCLAEGMSNKQVAQSLGISIRTVTVHVSNLLRKTRSASRTEAALWALQRRVSLPTR